MTDSTADAAKLLPCPFCLSTDIDPTGWASETKAGPQCQSCGATAESIEIWNTRPQPALPQGEPDWDQELINYHFTTQGILVPDDAIKLMRHVYRLGQASRPKVEDALVKELEDCIKFHNNRAEVAEARAAKAEAELAQAQEIMQHFVNKCDAGLARSTETYNDCKNWLERHAARRLQKTHD